MYNQIINDLLETKAQKITYFETPTRVIRASRTTYGGKFARGNIEITLTIGKPNYLETEFKMRHKGQVTGHFLYKYLPKKKQPVRK
jgi:hypothetical protein